MHKLLNFKGFESASIDLFTPVTLLIGRNGSGKTNFIEGIELMSQLANGRPLNEIVDIGRTGDSGFSIRGGLNNCYKGAISEKISKIKSGLNKSHDFTLEFSDATIKFNGQNEAVLYFLKIETSNSNYIKKEFLKIGNRVFFEANATKSGILNVQFDNFKSGVNKPTVPLTSDKTVLSRYAELISAINPKKANDALKAVKGIQNYLRKAYIFDPHPQMMREYQRTGQTSLDRTGINLSSVLYNLSIGNSEEKNTLNKILSRIKQLPEEEFEKFEFTVVERLHDVILGFKIKNSDELIDARLLSDGTLRALAILTALETTPIGSRVVIEEIDNGIHSSRLGILMEVVWETSLRRKLNILATTHNPATLNSLTSDQMKSVIVCHYDALTRSSKLTPLMDIEEIESMLEIGLLGDLVTKQTLEKHLLPSFKHDRQDKMLRWLSNLE